MSIYNTLTKFIYTFKEEHNESPQFIPISVKEIADLSGDIRYQVLVSPSKSDGMKLMGEDAFVTPFAEQMRARQVSMPITRIHETAEFNPTLTASELSNPMGFGMLKRLSAHILSNTSEVMFEAEFDPWARVKRLFGVAPKKRRFAVRATVLYPHIPVTLPHNRHVVKMSPVSEPAKCLYP